MKDKRISFRLDSATFGLLTQEATRRGFPSAAAFAAALAERLATIPRRKVAPPTIADEVHDLFTEQEEWEEDNRNRFDANQRR